MEVLTKTELRLRHKEIIGKINEGSIFIYPTDTIYGLGCSALISAAVKKIQRIKGRGKKPFSVWVPSIEWIWENCDITEKAKRRLLELPQEPFTLILKIKNKKAVSKELIGEGDTLGVRLPSHWFAKIVEEVGPIVSTSANKAGERFMTSLEDLDKDIENKVDFAIYEGPKEGRPSKLIYVEEDKVMER